MLGLSAAYAALDGSPVIGAPRRWVVVAHLAASAAPFAYVYSIRGQASRPAPTGNFAGTPHDTFVSCS